MNGEVFALSASLFLCISPTMFFFSLCASYFDEDLYLFSGSFSPTPHCIGSLCISPIYVLLFFFSGGVRGFFLRTKGWG